MERSLCGCSFLGMFVDRSFDGGTPKVMKSRPHFSNNSLWKQPPSPLSSRPERSVVEKSLCGCPFLGMFFDRSVA